jgi:hypothetical protein
VRIETAVYFILSFAIIMLKSRGIQGVNLDFSDLYQSVIEYPASVLINLLLFVPMGAVVFRYSASAPRAFGLALVAIAGMETLQYVLHLGIFDVVDIVVNMVGFSLGYLTLGILKEAGFRIIRVDERRVRIGRPRKGDAETGETDGAGGDGWSAEAGVGGVDVAGTAVAEAGEAAETAEAGNAKTGRLKLRIILVSVFFGALILLFIIGFALYDYQEYVPFETLTYHSA